MFKSFMLAISSALVLPLVMSACSKSSSSNITKENNKSIVCYFSATGNTAKAATRLAEIAGADIYEIVPSEKYSSDDLDWNDKTSRSTLEMNDSTSRPAIANPMPDLSSYDVVYIGYPNWWNTHPRIINSFIESADLKDKLVIPFMTSGGSDITNSEKMLHQQYPELNIGQGLLFNNVSDNDIKNWINQ